MNVNASVQYEVPGKKGTKQLVVRPPFPVDRSRAQLTMHQNVAERLNNVPAALLPVQLKEYLLANLCRKLQRDTNNYPWKLDDFELCGAGGSDLEKNPTIPPLYDKCLRTVKKSGVPTKMFISSTVVEAYLCVKKQSLAQYELFQAQVVRPGQLHHLETMLMPPRTMTISTFQRSTFQRSTFPLLLHLWCRWQQASLRLQPPPLLGPLRRRTTAVSEPCLVNGQSQYVF
jgi:hypothetical protein